MERRHRVAKKFFLKTDYSSYWEDRLRNGYEEPHLFDFVRSLSLRSGDSVLEVGCGGGRILSRISPLIRWGVGIDISRRALKAGVFGSHRPDNIDLVVADAAAIPFVDSCFDKSFAFSALFFVPDQTLAIEETARVGLHTTIEVSNWFSVEALLSIIGEIGSRAFTIFLRITGPGFASKFANLTLGPARAERLFKYQSLGVAHSQFPVWIWTPVRCLKKGNMKIVRIWGIQKLVPWWISPKIIIYSVRIQATGPREVAHGTTIQVPEFP